MHIDYDDPMMEPTARGHILARAPITIAIQADATGLRLLKMSLPDDLAGAIAAAAPHPAPRASLIMIAAKLGAIIRLAQAERYTLALSPRHGDLLLELTPR